MRKYPCVDYMKMKTLVISRIFLVTMEGKEERIMVPLADMFNHHYEKIGQSFWKYDQEKEQFTVTSQTVIPRGEYICENYGRKPNFRFLFYYGFLIENNSMNSIYLDLSLDSNDPLLSTKKNILGIKKDYINRFTVFNIFSEKQNFEFFKAVRFVVFKGNGQDLMQLCSGHPGALNDSIQISKIQMEPFSQENEIAMHEKIIQIAENYLKKYPTSLEEDEKILKTEKNLSFNERNIYVLRASEKKMLSFLIEMAKTAILVFKMPLEEAKKKIMEYSNFPYQKYLNDTVASINKKQNHK